MVFQLTQKLVFPDPHYGEPDGLLAVGGDLSVDRLLLAYSNGISGDATAYSLGMLSVKNRYNGGVP